MLEILVIIIATVLLFSIIGGVSPLELILDIIEWNEPILPRMLMLMASLLTLFSLAVGSLVAVPVTTEKEIPVNSIVFLGSSSDAVITLKNGEVRKITVDEIARGAEDKVILVEDNYTFNENRNILQAITITPATAHRYKITIKTK